MVELDAWRAEAWKRFQREGAVLVLPRVSNLDERSAVSSAAWPYSDIPPTEGMRLRQAIRNEWDELGRLKSGGR